MNAPGAGANESGAHRQSGAQHPTAFRYYVLAIVSVAAATGLTWMLQSMHFRDSAVPLLLFAVAISSWYGRRGPAALAVLLSTISVYYFFVEPANTIYIYRSEIPHFIIFVAFALIVSWFATIRRRAEEGLREQADLLNLAHDAVLVTDREGVIKYWNRGAEERYGWTAEQVIGKTVVDLLKRALPQPLEQIKAELMRTGRWEGELAHTKKDGTLAVVESRWSLQRDERGTPAAILETSNDITEAKRAQEALCRSEAYLAEAQHLTHTGSWADDGTMRPVYWSEEMYQIFGFDPRQGLPTREQPLERIHSEDREKFLQAFKTAIQQRRDAEVEYRIVLPGGTLKYAHGIGHPVFNANGELAEVIGTTVDITERRRAEDALRRSEAYLAEAQRLTHTGSWADDGTIRPVYWSEELYRIFEFDPQQGIPTRDQPIERVHPEDREKFLRAFQIVIQQKHDAQVEFRIVMTDGTIKHLHGIGHPVLNAAGDLVEIIGTTVDITERKLAEETLRRSEAYLAEAQKLSHTGSWAFDVSSRKTSYWSEEMYRIFGFDPRGPLPADDEQLQRIHSEDVGRFVASFEDSQKQEYTSFEFRIVLPDGTLKHAHVITHTDRNEAGDTVRLVGTLMDVTERKRAEEERERLRQLEAELTHMNRVSLMGELAASIAHEVNQPLSGVVSNGSACLRWLGGDAPNLEEARESARRIVRDGKRAADIIVRIRALATKTTAPREKVDLNEIIRGVLALVRDDAKKKGVTLDERYADDLSPVLCERVEMQQVMLNLVVNGIEAMSCVSERARELTIATRNIDPDHAQVTVEDSGTGLNPDTANKIFEPFYTTKPSGMGMGLSICRSIVQAHGGRLWATKRDGGGTMFHFTLPRHHERE
jgi:PAS domain S-box-containing protein